MQSRECYIVARVERESEPPVLEEGIEHAYYFSTRDEACKHIIKRIRDIVAISDFEEYFLEVGLMPEVVWHDECDPHGVVCDRLPSLQWGPGEERVMKATFTIT